MNLKFFWHRLNCFWNLTKIWKNNSVIFIKNFTLCIRVYASTLSTFNLLNYKFLMFFNQILWVVIKNKNFLTNYKFSEWNDSWDKQTSLSTRFLIIATLFWKGWFEMKFNILPEYVLFLYQFDTILPLSSLIISKSEKLIIFFLSISWVNWILGW